MIEFCIEAGTHGLVALANASEGHLLSEEEKQQLQQFVVQRVAGRVPVIVTVNHPSPIVAARASRFAEETGASAIMSLPPFSGRWRAGLDEISAYYDQLDQAVSIPLVLQDHVLSDIQLTTDYLVGLSQACEHLTHIKLESGNIIHKARNLSTKYAISPRLGFIARGGLRWQQWNLPARRDRSWMLRHHASLLHATCLPADMGPDRSQPVR